MSMADDVYRFIRDMLDEDEAVAKAERDVDDPGAWTYLVASSLAALRQLAEWHQPIPRNVNAGPDVPEGGQQCASCGDGEWYAVAAPCEHLRVIAAVWADSTSYRTDWRLEP